MLSITYLVFSSRYGLLVPFLSKINLKFQGFFYTSVAYSSFLTYRLKSFYEEGERDMMNEQILVLQNKVKNCSKFTVIYSGIKCMRCA